MSTSVDVWTFPMLRSLLRKYIGHVAYMEGIDFLRDIDRNDDVFTEDEWKYLKDAANAETDSQEDEAKDMLEFFFSHLQMHSPKMDGQHSYIFRGSGWPMTHCKGPTPEDAVRTAIKEVKRSRKELEVKE